MYPNRLGSIVRHQGTKNWVTLASKFTLSDKQIIFAISDECRSLRGCRWSDEAPFLVLDIDAGSKYHNEDGLNELKQALWRVGITKTKLYRSSESGGWHLYVFWTEWASSTDLFTYFKKWLQLEGFEVKSGTLEVFPSANALRLPLQAGFAWLNDQGLLAIERKDFSADAALFQFMADLQSNAIDWKPVRERLEAAISELSKVSSIQPEQMNEFASMVEDATAEIDQQRWKKGQEYWLNGLTKNGQRHEGILFVGYYLWYGDGSNGLSPLPGRRAAAQRQRLIRRWIEQNHNGFCSHIAAGNWKKVEDDIERAVSWRRFNSVEERVPYLVTDRLVDRQMEVRLTVDQLRTANENREKAARHKIKNAVEELQQARERVSIRAVKRITGCSINTIRKHRELLLSNGSGDLSPGGCQLSVVLEEVEPGLDVACSSSGSDFDDIAAEPSPVVYFPVRFPVLVLQGASFKSVLLVLFLLCFGTDFWSSGRSPPWFSCPSPRC